MLIGAGIVGSSGVGALHADALKRLGVTIAGVAAVSPAVAQRDAERLGATRSFASAEELIASDTVDVVHVCTPNDLHLPLCRAALAAGKHIVAEKPLCTSAADAEDLLRLAEDAGAVHALCHGYRHYAMVRALRELVRRDALGRVHTIGAAWLNEELLTIDPGHWMLDPAQMGPALALADVGVHLWDLVEHLTGASITEVLCETRAARPGAGAGAPEDTALLLMRLAGGAVASATVSQAAPGQGNTVTLELIGERATAHWDIREPDVLTVGELGGARRVLERGTKPVEALGIRSRLPAGQPEGHAEALLDLLERVYDRVRGAGTPTDHPTFADGVRGLQVLEALRHSAREGRWTAIGTPPPS